MELGKFLQIGIITEDVNKSVAEFEKFGFTGWVVQSFEPRFIPGMMVNGEKGTFTFNGAMWKNEHMEIELIEPTNESVFMDYLREHGPGVHHLAFRPVEGYEKFMEDYKNQGYQSLFEVETGDGTPCFAYLDTIKQLGFYTEIHHGEPGDPTKCK